MKRMLIATMALLVLLVVGCAKPVELEQGSSGDAVFISITKNGISADASEVVIRNYRAGARAEMTYRIHNGTAAAIQPEIYFVDYADVADYSKANGATKAPMEMSSWLTIPELDEVPPGSIKDYVVAIEIPEDVPKLPKKFGFQVQVAGNTGGKLQTAVGTWWLVNMR